MTSTPPARVVPNASLVSDELTTAIALLLARSAGRRRNTLVACTLPVEPSDPIGLFTMACELGEDPVLWLQPSEDFSLVAIGSASAVRREGPDRFEQVAAAWADLLEGAFLDGPTTQPPAAGPLLVGGFAFSPDAAGRDPLWDGFDGARLVVPRLLVASLPSGTWLTAAVVLPPAGPASADEGNRAVELAGLWRRVSGLSAPAFSALRPPPPTADLRCMAEEPDVAGWRDAVGRLAGAVGRGRVDKVVLARRMDLRSDCSIDVAAALRRLAASAPESTTFAVTRGERVFIGATPERLAWTDGPAFRTIALAGSIQRGADDEADERLARTLLASEKDREEHAVVVTMLRDMLTPLAEEIRVPPHPDVVRLRHVQHLATAISGRLRNPTGVLPLVARLHPTPAVGGAPRDLALELIGEEERLDRGWYGGPLGWVDRRGDGEFVVAIRSGIVEGDRASLFAGCGIVADSEPDREWLESEWKLRALASAIGNLEK